MRSMHEWVDGHQNHTITNPARLETPIHLQHKRRKHPQIRHCLEGVNAQTAAECVSDSDQTCFIVHSIITVIYKLGWSACIGNCQRAHPSAFRSALTISVRSYRACVIPSTHRKLCSGRMMLSKRLLSLPSHTHNALLSGHLLD